MKKASTQQLPSKQLLHFIAVIIVVCLVFYFYNQKQQESQTGSINSKDDFNFGGSFSKHAQTELSIPAHPDAFTNSKLASLNRLNEYKKHIELRGYRDAYKNGKKCVDEKYFQRGFLPFWINTLFDVNPEVNNGRGQVDFTVSIGARDKTVIEFKLASNLKNAKAQLDHYAYANSTHNAIMAIFYFTKNELKKAEKFFAESGMNKEDVILIDVRKDNKESASRIRKT
jgi:hypothetical protein